MMVRQEQDKLLDLGVVDSDICNEWCIARSQECSIGFSITGLPLFKRELQMLDVEGECA